MTVQLYRCNQLTAATVIALLRLRFVNTDSARNRTSLIPLRSTQEVASFTTNFCGAGFA